MRCPLEIDQKSPSQLHPAEQYQFSYVKGSLSDRLQAVYTVSSSPATPQRVEVTCLRCRNQFGLVFHEVC
jgi:hypothetical protein